MYKYTSIGNAWKWQMDITRLGMRHKFYQSHQVIKNYIYISRPSHQIGEMSKTKIRRRNSPYSGNTKIENNTPDSNIL
jgi:hypothetical protein